MGTLESKALNAGCVQREKVGACMWMTGRQLPHHKHMRLQCMLVLPATRALDRVHSLEIVTHQGKVRIDIRYNTTVFMQGQQIYPSGREGSGVGRLAELGVMALLVSVARPGAWVGFVMIGASAAASLCPGPWV